MPIFPLDSNYIDRAVLRRAAELLRAGELVAFPTETVYGLGANALDSSAVAKIFALKERPSFNPLIVHVEDENAAQNVVAQWPQSAQKLAEAFWPGPLSLVLPKREIVPDNVTAGLNNVAVRAPAHPIAQALLRECGLPLAAPSANRFTRLSPTLALHVANAFPELFVLDGGACAVGIESTVLDLCEAPTLLRPGAISRAQIEAVIGAVRLAEEIKGNAPRASPGMIEKHYAPRAPLYIAQRHKVRRTYQELKEQGKKSGILFRGDKRGQTAVLHINAPTYVSIWLPRYADDPAREAADYARELYAALHVLDESGCDVILVEAVPETEEWRGVRDRLQRASK